jgi:hypothetical protein
VLHVSALYKPSLGTNSENIEEKNACIYYSMLYYIILYYIITWYLITHHHCTVDGALNIETQVDICTYVKTRESYRNFIEMPC